MTTSALKTALLVGATGLIGDLLLRRLVDSAVYDRITVLTRKPLALQHPRVQEIPFQFDAPNGLLVRADDVYCCLGTTIKKAGSKEAFRQVDYQYPMDIARLARENGATQFAIVTAMGASVDSSFFYNRVKGEVERDLTALRYPALLIFRPSLLLGDRQESRLGERIGAGVMRLLAPLIPARYKGIDAAKVANAMLTTMQQELSGKHIFESDKLQDF